MQVFVGLLDEVAQQAAPGFGDGRQARADDLQRGDLGELLERAVPHEDFLILGQRADAHWQLLQGLAVIAAQGVQFRGEAGQARVIFLQPAFDEVDVLGDVAIGAVLVGQEILDDVLGHAGAHQAGEVGFDTVAQAAQRVGAMFVEG